MNSLKIKEYESLFDIDKELKPIRKNSIDENCKLNKIVICKDCQKPAVTHGLDTWECPDCGSYLEEFIDNTAEWRMYPDGSKTDSIEFSYLAYNKCVPSEKSVKSIEMLDSASSFDLANFMLL